MFGRSPFSPEPPEDGDLSDAIDRALFLVIAILFAGFLSLVTARADTRPEADAALVLAADVSGSMTNESLELQRKAYIAALTDPGTWSAIQGGPHGRVALAVFEWASADDQRVVVPWTIVASRADLERVAATLRAAPIQSGSQTGVGAAIRFATALLNDAPVRAVRRIIDVSGDGPNNNGPPAAAARDDAVRQGITINGLPIITAAEPRVVEFYEDEVIGGPGHFVMPARGMGDFQSALRTKLILEIGGHTSRHAFARLHVR